MDAEEIIIYEEKDWIIRMLNTDLFVSRIRRRNRKKRWQRIEEVEEGAVKGKKFIAQPPKSELNVALLPAQYHTAQKQTAAFFNSDFSGLPRWLSGKESTCQYKRHKRHGVFREKDLQGK